MGWPEIRYPDGTEIAPQLDLRVRLELYAGVRPARAIPGIPLPLADPRASDIDLVLVRESTEGLFASRGRGVVEDDREARDTMVITRAGSERVHEFAFRLAERRRARGRPGSVTCVDKANVFVSMAFFRKIFDEVAARHPGIAARHHYVDATALDLVRKPWELRRARHREHVRRHPLRPDARRSSAAWAWRLRPTSAIGTACSSRATAPRPDIAGQGKANPTAMILSAAMMLDWLARAARRPRARGGGAAARARGRRRVRVRASCVPFEFGGQRRHRGDPRRGGLANL